jgi:hypothetical protein
VAYQAVELLMRLFSYIVARDFGFAPNPFHGWCTLATCKPKIRRAAQVGDWVIGTGAKTKYDLAGRLIYAMQVGETLDFEAYWDDLRFSRKRPILNGSLKQVYGDNIYTRMRGRWHQADSHHSLQGGRHNSRNIARDTEANRVLVAERFVYFGSNAPVIPKAFRQRAGADICCVRQGHKIHDNDVALAFEKWIHTRDQWGVQGMPLEFARHARVAPRPR